VTGPAALTRAFLPGLRAARGHVVFVNAAPGLHRVPNWSAYTASSPQTLASLVATVLEFPAGRELT
jgi:short-subunit dehydrogenase